MAFAYIAATGFIDLGQLNNMYLDLIEGAVFTEASVAERYLQAALVIALEYLARRVGHECIINGVDIRDASTELMTQLRFAAEFTWEASTPEELFEFQDAHLWVLYVGALDEQRKMRMGRDVVVLWFGPRQKSQALQTGVKTWSQMRCIAERFLYASFIDPDGSIWFEDLVNS